MYCYRHPRCPTLPTDGNDELDCASGQGPCVGGTCRMNGFVPPPEERGPEPGLQIIPYRTADQFR